MVTDNWMIQGTDIVKNMIISGCIFLGWEGSPFGVNSEILYGIELLARFLEIRLFLLFLDPYKASSIQIFFQCSPYIQQSVPLVDLNAQFSCRSLIEMKSKVAVTTLFQEEIIAEPLSRSQRLLFMVVSGVVKESLV